MGIYYRGISWEYEFQEMLACALQKKILQDFNLYLSFHFYWIKLNALILFKLLTEYIISNKVNRWEWGGLSPHQETIVDAASQLQ